MGNAFGFVASKEVVVAPWFKKPDVELVDASGELLTIYLDDIMSFFQLCIKRQLFLVTKCTALHGKQRQQHIREKILLGVYSTRILAFLSF